MTSERIAIVGIGLRYPDAANPAELWENVLAGRRAFRRLPDERMNHADYYSPDPAAPDRFYARKAAVLRDFTFDRVKYQVAGSTYRSTDLTHWLALDVAAHALADAGFPSADGLPRVRTGVVVGNSLTGEFARANLMRLRWPYVRRTVAAALGARGWADGETAAFLGDLELRYKEPFPAIDEDTLAGGLANTIAGRICNHFDLNGGGFTVDGACSSSLLSVAVAAKALAAGELDAVLAGGVDLSIDPFEVIGFAKTGALATGEMMVYDRGSNGFWPGEGAGMLVLMREDDALARGLRSYASITGWGISSDGKGGITRPEATGHRLALARAYDRAGYGVETVSYFEGHGTGTALGDATEIDALSSARRDAAPAARPAALSTIKGNFGHTKAAAGVAGLIKAALAIHHQVIPPATGHFDPHPALLGDTAAMYVPQVAGLWPDGERVRAGVSAMGFGGINTHITVQQAPDVERRTGLDERTTALVAGRQDAELLVLDGHDAIGIRERVTTLLDVVPKLASAELADLAGALVAELDPAKRVRAALVAVSPEDAESKLTRLLARLDSGERAVFSAGEGVFLDHRTTAPKISYLFPGQGSGRGAAGALRRRFTVADDLYRGAGLAEGGDQVATEVAQPRIVAGSLAALRVLRQLGLEADTAVGHSLGELTALHWGGAMDEAGLLDLAAARGRVMASAGRGGGAMAGIAAGPEKTAEFGRGEGVVIAGFNGPRQTVVSGPEDAVDRVCAKASAEGVTATRIRVSHAFHSPLVEPAALALDARLAVTEFARLDRAVFSTVRGGEIDPAADLRVLLRDQVLFPVRFHEAAAKAVAGADLVLEVGPGRVLAGLLAEIAPGKPVLSLDTDSGSLTSVLRAAGAAYVLGAPVQLDALFDGRVIRPVPLDGAMTFLASPCEAAPELSADLVPPDQAGGRKLEPARDTGGFVAATRRADSTTIDLLRRLAAERVELPLETVQADTHPLDDLHLSSITVGQLVNQVTQELGRPVLQTTPNFATVRLGELADLIDELAQTARPGDAPGDEAPGIAPWVRPFSADHVEAPLPVVTAPADRAHGAWTVFASPGHPLAEPLAAALATSGLGNGVLLCLPSNAEDQVALFLDAGRAAVTAAAGTRFVVVQCRFGASGLAKTLHLENPSVPTTLVELAEPDPAGPDELRAAVARVVAEAAATEGFSAVRYDAAGTRTIPVLRPAPVRTALSGGSPLGPDDVLLVTGGGKGITAECALAMASDAKAKLVLVGRADPAEDTELAANLARMDAAGIQCRYERADVTSADEVKAVVERVEAGWGPVTAVLHGAGRNHPSSLVNLTEEEFRRTLAPKTTGLRAVLGSVAKEHLKLLITFGSIIGRAGLRGEAHYATANDWMTELALDFGRAHPATRVVALEWSVWSGAGMGERLGVIEGLMRDGIVPIGTDTGVAVLLDVLADPTAGPLLTVSGRASGLPTVNFGDGGLPLLRFLDRVLVHYPGIELVTEADLTVGSDPYLTDHELDGDLLLPAVMGMEAMAQAAVALTGHQGPTLLENAEFLRPIVVRPGGTATIRLVALVKEPGVVDVALRTDETGFGADHFRARLRLPRPAVPGKRAPAEAVLPLVPIDPITELYGEVLFQGKRFQRLLAYRHLSARRAVAEISTRSPAEWFAAFLPQERRLADPGTRDAMMHAIQCCVPDATLLPQRVDRLYLADRTEQDGDYVVLDARERSYDGNSYVYDLEVRDSSGIVVERWDGLTLRAVGKGDGSGPWVPSLLGPHLQRALERLLDLPCTVVVEPDPDADSARRAQTELAAGRALGRRARVRYRPDGRPEVDGTAVSASHGAGLTLVTTGFGRLGCDVEPVTERGAEEWAGLLGAGQLGVRDLLMAESGEDLASTSTRVWCALECLRKAGSATQALTVDRVHPDGWSVLSAGDAQIATWTTAVRGWPGRVAFAILTGEEA